MAFSGLRNHRKVVSGRLQGGGGSEWEVVEGERVEVAEAEMERGSGH